MSDRGHVDSSYSVKADSYGRRTWDKDEFERRAKARADEEREKRQGTKRPYDMYKAKEEEAVDSDSDDSGGFDEFEFTNRTERHVKIRPDAPTKRTLLKKRDYKIDLESRLGKSTVITKNSPSCAAGGYYCDVCDCVVKDSINYLDHVNGKKHQRNLGMSMKIERSSLDQVKERFSLIKKKREEKEKEYNLSEKVSDLKEEEEKYKSYLKEKKKEKKQKQRLQEEATFGPVDEGMAAMMGFAGFGGSKKN